MTVLLLGATSMIGHQMLAHFQTIGLEVVGTSRQAPAPDEPQNLYPFDVDSDSIDLLLEAHPDVTVIVNNIGVIKSNIQEGDSTSELNAIQINSVFPHLLAESARQRGIHVLQIATDCVYSGQDGLHDETSPHDAWDVYGKTKSLGEVTADNVTLLRCSVIGREQGRSSNLIEWVLAQPKNAHLSGYTNHLWNGLSTLAFSKICAGIIVTKNFSAGVHHVVPLGEVSKQELVTQIAHAFGRDDITVSPVETPVAVNRTLSTNVNDVNKKLWADAGYTSTPSVSQLLNEYAETLA